MLTLTEGLVRESFLNASQKDLKQLTLPSDFDRLDWGSLDYLGWRDRKVGRRAYLVVPVDGTPTGVVLQQTETRPRRRAQCSLCQDVHLPNDVVFFGARRAGAAGRKGDSVGTLICAEFQCSVNARTTYSIPYLGFDVDAARDERIARLRERAAGFVAAVEHGS